MNLLYLSRFLLNDNWKGDSIISRDRMNFWFHRSLRISVLDQTYQGTHWSDEPGENVYRMIKKPEWFNIQIAHN